MLADSCLIISEILSRGPTDSSYALFVIIRTTLFCNLSRALRVVSSLFTLFFHNLQGLFIGIFTLFERRSTRVQQRYNDLSFSNSYLIARLELIP